MKILTRADAARFLLEHDHFAILSHRRPDGDTVGSSAALCRGLRQLGKTAHVLVNKEVTPRFAWLHEALTKPWVEEGDTIVSVDVASPEMLPADFRPLLGRIALRIDHHSSATSFTEQELVDGDSASCAEVVWDVLELMGVKADRALAEAVYVGVSTDTGCFRFSNTTAHTFSVAALCTRAGARIYELNQELFETNTLERLKMQAWIVEHLELLRGGEYLCYPPCRGGGDRRQRGRYGQHLQFPPHGGGRAHGGDPPGDGGRGDEAVRPGSPRLRRHGGHRPFRRRRPQGRGRRVHEAASR